MGKHGHYKHPLYNTWRGMIGRCETPYTRYYENYGGRGITVCQEWHDAGTFIKWGLDNGWSEGLQIDRIDNDGNYEPGNCRFVTRKQNGRNTRGNHLVTANGVTKTVIEWSEESGVEHGTIRSRLRRGWTAEQALSLPLRRGKKP